MLWANEMSFRWIGHIATPLVTTPQKPLISRFRCFTQSAGEMSYRLKTRGQGYQELYQSAQ